VGWRVVICLHNAVSLDQESIVCVSVCVSVVSLPQGGAFRVALQLRTADLYAVSRVCSVWRSSCGLS
jgi:hypothetical protein